MYISVKHYFNEKDKTLSIAFSSRDMNMCLLHASKLILYLSLL